MPFKIPVSILPALLLTALMARGAAAGAPPEGITIFVPESLTSVSSESVSGEGRGTSISVISTTGLKVALVGRVEGKGEPPGLEILNNGHQGPAPVFHKDYFHAQVILSLGVNQIELRWHRGSGPWSSKPLSIFRSSKLEGGVSSSYPPYIFHKPENEEHCQECHQMSLTMSEIKTGMEKSCLQCHGDLTSNIHVHGPVAVGICTVCHDPESRPNKFRVDKSDADLCYGCHMDRKDIDSKKKLMHGPVGAGMCTICHDPHSSPFDYQLVKAKTEICVMCHQEDANRWLGQKSLHPPFKSGDCAGCHDPHSSDFKYNLKAERGEICALCHELPVPGHPHEPGKRPQFNLPDDFPMTNDGRTMCLTCHDPHGAQGSHLTRRDGCDGCHPK